MYKDVIVSEETISANEVSIVNGENILTPVVIDRSVCHLYARHENKENMQYLALRYSDPSMFSRIENLLKGCPTAMDVHKLSNVYIRYGWLDRTLNSLHWINLLDFYRMICKGEIVGTHKGKLQYISMVLGLSRKSIVHMEPQIFNKLIEESKTCVDWGTHMIKNPECSSVRSTYSETW